MFIVADLVSLNNSFQQGNGGSSILVDSLFFVTFIVCMGSVVGTCFVIQYSQSFLILQPF